MKYELNSQGLACPSQAGATNPLTPPTITTVDGHTLSDHNAISLVKQRDGKPVSVVGGFKQWLKKGRVVRRGERCLLISIPLPPRKSINEPTSPVVEPSNNTFNRTGDPTSTRFGYARVFDVSQTEPLPRSTDVSTEASC